MPPGMALVVTLRGSNYRCLEQIFMVPKGFEPSNFDCNLNINKNTYDMRRGNNAIISYAISEDLDELAHPCSLSRAFTCRLHILQYPLIL